MAEILRIFPPKQFLKTVRWMVPATALIAYLWGLGAGKDANHHYVHRYIGGSFPTAWGIWLGIFILIWFMMRLQTDRNQKVLASRTTCPTCGQKMPGRNT